MSLAIRHGTSRGFAWRSSKPKVSHTMAFRISFSGDTLGSSLLWYNVAQDGLPEKAGLSLGPQKATEPQGPFHVSVSTLEYPAEGTRATGFPFNEKHTRIDVRMGVPSA